MAYKNAKNMSIDEREWEWEKDMERKKTPRLLDLVIPSARICVLSTIHSKSDCIFIIYTRTIIHTHTYAHTHTHTNGQYHSNWACRWISISFFFHSISFVLAIIKLNEVISDMKQKHFREMFPIAIARSVIIGINELDEAFGRWMNAFMRHSLFFHGEKNLCLPSWFQTIRAQIFYLLSTARFFFLKLLPYAKNCVRDSGHRLTSLQVH